MDKRAFSENKEILFFRENGLHTSGFNWYRTQFKIDKKNNLSVNLKYKIEPYKPDIDLLVIDLANLDIFKNEEILGFADNYGLLGLIDFYKSDWVCNYTGIEPESVFGIGNDNLLSGPYGSYNRFPLTMNPSNPFFYKYVEPLELFKKAAYDFQEACSVVSCNFYKKENVFNDEGKNIDLDNTKFWETELRWIENHNVLKLTIVNDHGKPIFASPINSLISAAYACLVWNTTNGKTIKKCNALKKRQDEICQNYYWENGKQRYCSKSCRDRMAQYNKRNGESKPKRKNKNK